MRWKMALLLLSVVTGCNGAQGPQGPAGAQGPTGETGPQGPPGAGTVTGVTASAPLTSSGGNAPNISIGQASATAAGYVSSTDWTIFDGKLSAVSHDGTLTGVGTAASPLSVVPTNAGAGLTAITVFSTPTTNATYSTPAGTSYLVVELWGGGGGGAGPSSGTGGGGGGGGGYSLKLIANPAASYFYTVGAGGLAGMQGANGSPGDQSCLGTNPSNACASPIVGALGGCGAVGAGGGCGGGGISGDLSMGGGYGASSVLSTDMATPPGVGGNAPRGAGGGGGSPGGGGNGGAVNGCTTCNGQNGGGGALVIYQYN
jgi:hypothetical protein